MMWKILKEERPVSAGRYLVVVEGPHYEIVDISYYNGGFFKVDDGEKVIKWQDLPPIND